MTVLATIRAAWTKAIADALVLSREGAAPHPPTVLAFRRETLKLKAVSFPSRGEAGVADLAEAFLDTVKAFSLAAPHRRGIFAPALAACAKALDDVLDELRSAEAQSSWMRQMGRDD